MVNTPRRLIYIYFGGTVLAFIWIFVNFAAWCPDVNEIELERKKVQIIEQKHETQRKKIDILHRKIQELKTELAVSSDQQKKKDYRSKSLPIIYVITPTKIRLEQKADLTRLSHTLRHVPNLHWIVIEDSEHKSNLVETLLTSCKIPYTHLHATTPEIHKLKGTDPNWLKPRGVPQRNAGIKWLRERATNDGVVYFADDDNTYDLGVFEEMRYTKTVSVWPVGLVGYLRYESPVVQNGKVTSWYTYWKPNRAFAMDMAGFAVNLQLILDHPNAWFVMDAGRGNLESSLLSQLDVKLEDLEPRANNCSKILVWHTRTEKSSLKNEEKMLQRYGYNSDITIEV